MVTKFILRHPCINEGFSEIQMLQRKRFGLLENTNWSYIQDAKPSRHSPFLLENTNWSRKTIQMIQCLRLL